MCTPCFIILLLTSALGLSQGAEIVASESPHLLTARSLRLPNDTYPLSYQLHISTNIHLGEWRFAGNATIDIEIRRSTNEIVVHAKNLSDIQITLRLLDSSRPEELGELVDDVTHTYDPYATFLIIHPRVDYQAFEAGQRYRLHISYTGLMSTRPKGLYWMSYEEPLNNRTVYVAATQSEPTFARLIMPCYDEPAFKSNYSIRLTHSSSLMAISNMPVKELVNHGELTTTTFQTTPPMSTYLVAFVISNFDHISETYRGVTQSIYSSPTSKDKGRTALKNVVLTVAALEDYFGFSYMLPKLDHVALKKNQGAAMENWGLITFRDDSLLSQDVTDKHKMLKYKVMQNHEISHQWFGNLVSPEWWSYVWMNEGFATYFSYVITDLLHPEDNVMEIFNRDEAEHAYSYSSFFDVRPMTHYVETESDIMKVFDIISYKRAACVIKMFHHAFHQKTFVQGINRYLKKFQYSVVSELDLFDAVQESVLDDARFQHQTWKHIVRDIMLSWTHSEWLPIVSVIRNYENNTITLRQRSIHSKTEHWWIPLNFATAQSPSFVHTHAEYFMPPVVEHTLTLEELQLQLGGRDWLIVNKQQTGFYHVLYDTDNLHAIARQLQLNHSVIHAMNRAALFQDLAPLIERNEFESVDALFELFKYLEFEDDLTPWSQVANTIEFFDNNLYGTTAYSLFKQFVRRLVAPTFLRLFHKDKAEVVTMDILVRTDILSMACRVDMPECLDYTHRLVLEYVFKDINFESDYPDYYAIHDAILCMGVRHLSDQEFEKLIDLLIVTDQNTAMHDDLIYSLRCTRNHRRMHHYLNVLVGENFTYNLLNERESMFYLVYVFKSNVAARSSIWHFIDQNYKQLARSPHFVVLFNDIAEFVPERQRAYFATLHQNIDMYLRAEHLNSKEPLIPVDSRRVGKKMRNSEEFLDKFEHQIHNWLLKELSPADSDAAYAASFSVGNGSTRPTSLLSAASDIVRSAIGV
ncbi:aminopeptidase N [Drosophila hydei]|uniref:Aminopeptidase n=1 Tax=Drosophila hydei TaxID=7224 RepID=A0A6J1MG44_DROHY|nr:aminopeptidase N [Drosophila hydei]